MPGGGGGSGSEALVRFEDVVVPFSREEWKMLTEWQKELYWKVLKDAYNALLFVGRPVTKSAVLAWLEQCELHDQNSKGTQQFKNGDSSDSFCASSKQSAEMCRGAEEVGPFTVVHDKSEEVAAPCGNVGGAPEHLHTPGVRQGSPVRAESLPQTELRKRIQELAKFAYSPRTVTASEPDKCGLRGERLRLNGQPQIHEQISTKDVSFYCPECGVGFQSSSHLRMHWRGHIHAGMGSRKASPSLEPGPPVHPQGSQARERLHLCVLCGKSFQRYLGFLQHQKGHEAAKPHPCVQCELVFMFQSELEIHEESHLEERLCEHALCGKNCICDISLQLHVAFQLREHSKSGFQSPEALPQKAHGEGKPYSCGLCQQQYTLKVNLETHYWYCHKEWVLTHQLNCSAQNTLRKRKKVQAKQENSIPAPNDCSKGVQNSVPPSLPSCTLRSCSYCDKWFVSKLSLRRHQKRHKRGGAAKRDKKGGVGGPLLAHVMKKLHKCQECGEKFVYKWQLLAHLKSHAQAKQPLSLHRGNILAHDRGKQGVHTKKGACKNGKPALTANQRRRHELCEQCGHSFSKSFMPRHQAFHAGLRYRCLLCEKICTFKSGAYYHVRRHWQKGDFAPCLEGKKQSCSKPCLCIIERIYVGSGPPLQQQHTLDSAPQPSKGSPAKNLCAESGQSLGSSSHLGVQPHTGKQEDPVEQEQSGGWKSALEQYRNSFPRQYKCQDCGKEFAYMAFLMMHRRTHKSKQVHQCADCGKKFISSFYLDVHRKKHVKEERVRLEKGE